MAVPLSRRGNRDNFSCKIVMAPHPRGEPHPVHCTPFRHRADCRPGRPHCRYRRKCKGLCNCDAYWWGTHRANSGACRTGIPYALTKRRESA